MKYLNIFQGAVSGHWVPRLSIPKMDSTNVSRIAGNDDDGGRVIKMGPMFFFLGGGEGNLLFLPGFFRFNGDKSTHEKSEISRSSCAW